MTTVGHDRTVYRPLPYQVEPCRHLQGSTRFILQCPTGWGKTKVLQFLLADDLANSSRKALIAVPQNIIKPGFDASITLETGRNKFHWSVFPVHSTLPSRVRALRHFLEVPVSDSRQSQIFVTTHASLTQAGITPDQLTDTTVVIDECHHSMIDDNSPVANRLGDLIHNILDAELDTTSLWLATATLGRGDGCPIVRAEDIESFEKYEVTFEEYWQTLRYLKHFKSMFVVSEDPFNSFREILQDQAPTLIYCPPHGSRYLGAHTKQDFLRKIRQALLTETNYLWEPGQDKSGAILDLTDTNADKRDEIAFIERHPDRIAAIIAVGMMKEGADWPALRRIIDFCPSLSPTARIQKFGRGTRDYPGKTHFDYYLFLPEAPNLSDEYRQRCNEYLGQLVLSLVDSSYYCHSLPWSTPGSKKGAKSYNQRYEILQAAVEAVIGLGERTENGKRVNNDMLLSAIESAIEHLVDDPPATAKEVFQHLLSYTPKKLDPQITMQDLEIELIEASQILLQFKQFCSIACGTKTFAQMRTQITEARRLEWIRMFEQLRDNPDLLKP